MARTETRPEGLEPPAYRSATCRSNPLSYGRRWVNYSDAPFGVSILDREATILRASFLARRWSLTMFTRRFPLLPAVLGLGMLLSLAPAASQDAPPAAPPAGEAPVLLVHKFKPGQVRNYRLEANGSMSLNLAAAAGLGPVPMELKATGTYSEKTTAVTEGVATITQKMDTFSMTNNILGTNVGFRVANGKVSMTVNGQPAPEGGAGGAGMAGLGRAQLSQITRPTTFTRTARGVEQRGTGADAVSQAVGTESIGLYFPETPVNVGDSWEQTVKTRVGGGPVAGGAQEIEVKSTYTLKAIEEKAGARHAIIEVTSSGALGPEGMIQTSQDTSGKFRFDIARGGLISGQVKLNFTTQLPGGAVPGGGDGGANPAAPAGQPAGGGQIDGEMTMVLMEVVSKPATAKPAARKPARKRAPARRK